MNNFWNVVYLVLHQKVDESYFNNYIHTLKLEKHSLTALTC
jgi:hypothetical protein